MGDGMGLTLGSELLVLLCVSDTDFLEIHLDGHPCDARGGVGAVLGGV